MDENLDLEVETIASGTGRRWRHAVNTLEDLKTTDRELKQIGREKISPESDGACRGGP